MDSARDGHEPAPPTATSAATATAGAGARRRGRPYRLPVDTTPMAAPVPDLRNRLAWLLGLSRLHAADPEVSRRDVFIERLRERGVAVDSTRLSRWESGHVAVPHQVVEAYEQVTGLRPGQLVLGGAALGRHGETPMGPRRGREADAALGHARLDDLFALVRDGAARGHDWIELCDLLTRHPHVYLVPDTWAQVADLLAGELGRSTGLAYVARLRALALLVAHPTSRRHAARAIGSVVTNPAVEFVIHPLALLEEIDEPGATDLLVRVLRGRPGYQRAGAAWAVAGRIEGRRLLPGELERYEAAVVDIVVNGPTATTRMDALTVVAALPEESRRRVSSSVTDQERRKSLDLARLHGELRDPEVARTVAAQVAAAVQAATPTPHATPPDQMLARLVREGLFHVSHRRRHQATLLLSVSPYADQLGVPLLRLAGEADETTAALALTMLFQLARPAHRDALMALALRERRPAARVTALMALSQVVGRLDAAEALALRRAVPATGPAADAATYVLGMGSAPDAAAGAATADQAAAAAWWAGRPPVADD